MLNASLMLIRLRRSLSRSVKNYRRLPFMQFVAFLLVGAINTLLGLLIIFAAKFLFGAGDIVANGLGYGIGLCVSFFLNGRFTFSSVGEFAPAFRRFVLAAAISYFLNLAVVMLAIDQFYLDGYLAQAIGVPVYTISFYFLAKHFVFR